MYSYCNNMLSNKVLNMSLISSPRLTFDTCLAGKSLFNINSFINNSQLNNCNNNQQQNNNVVHAGRMRRGTE